MHVMYDGKLFVREPKDGGEFLVQSKKFRDAAKLTNKPITVCMLLSPALMGEQMMRLQVYAPDGVVTDEGMWYF